MHQCNCIYVAVGNYPILWPYERSYILLSGRSLCSKYIKKISRMVLYFVINEQDFRYTNMLYIHAHLRVSKSKDNFITASKCSAKKVWLWVTWNFHYQIFVCVSCIDSIWKYHCMFLHYQSTRRCGYNAVKLFTTDPPKLARQGEVWGVFCGHSVWMTFCLSSCD